MRIIATGGADYADEATVHSVLSDYDTDTGEKPVLVISTCKIVNEFDGNRPYVLCKGEAPGLARMAYGWATSAGWTVELHQAERKKRGGRAAVAVRNRKIAELGADLCIVFPGRRGTADMYACAEAVGIPIRRVYT